MDEAQKRRLLVLALVLVPVLAGLGIVALAHFAGPSDEGGTATIRSSSNGSELPEPALAPAAAGTPAPAVRLTDARRGTRFDSSALAGQPLAIVFLSTACEAAAAPLRQALTAAAGAAPAVLAITADPWRDTIPRVRAWLRRHREPPSFHYLLGSVAQLRPYWRTWGLSEPKRSDATACPGVVPVHLVSGAGINAGLVDLGAGTTGAGLAHDLAALGG